MLLNSKLDKLVLGKCLRQSLFKRYYIIINNKTYKTLIKTLTPTFLCSNHSAPAKINFLKFIGGENIMKKRYIIIGIIIGIIIIGGIIAMIINNSKKDKSR